jgi:hypothetical protein
MYPLVYTIPAWYRIDYNIEECQAKLSHTNAGKSEKKPKMLQFCATVDGNLSVVWIFRGRRKIKCDRP